MQVSNVRLTTAAGHRPGALEGNSRIRQPQARSATVEGGFASDRALTIDRRMISSPNRLHPRVEPEGMLWRIMRVSYSELAFIQSATARPIAGPESSWMKCEPGTVTSVWFFQPRQKSLTAPIRMAPGSALTNNFGMSVSASHFE